MATNAVEDRVPEALETDIGQDVPIPGPDHHRLSIDETDLEPTIQTVTGTPIFITVVATGQTDTAMRTTSMDQNAEKQLQEARLDLSHDHAVQLIVIVLIVIVRAVQSQAVAVTRDTADHAPSRRLDPGQSLRPDLRTVLSPRPLLKVAQSRNAVAHVISRTTETNMSSQVVERDQVADLKIAPVKTELSEAVKNAPAKKENHPLRRIRLKTINQPV